MSDAIDRRLAGTLGEIDHRLVAAPYLRLTTWEHGVSVWDLRVVQPNRAHLEMATVHSLEHMLATYLRRQLAGVANLGPMGCQTGFYIVVAGLPGYEAMLDAVARAFGDCLEATSVPLANEVQCGWARNHDLAGAQRIAAAMLAARPEWTQIAGWTQLERETPDGAR